MALPSPISDNSPPPSLAHPSLGANCRAPAQAGPWRVIGPVAGPPVVCGPCLNPSRTRVWEEPPPASRVARVRWCSFFLTGIPYASPTARTRSSRTSRSNQPRPTNVCLAAWASSGGSETWLAPRSWRSSATASRRPIRARSSGSFTSSSSTRGRSSTWTRRPL